MDIVALFKMKHPLLNSISTENEDESHNLSVQDSGTESNPINFSEWSLHTGLHKD